MEEIMQKRGPGRPPKIVSNEGAEQEGEKTHGSEIQRLEALVGGLSAQVESLRNPRHGLVRKNRTKEFNVNMREYLDGEQVKGLVTRISNVKEVKDKTEAKRFVGVCSLDLIDPRTGKSETIEGVDYLKFLNDAKTVLCKILKRESRQREYLDPRPGVGIGMRRDASGNIVPGSETEFTVFFSEETFDLEVLEGEFQGLNLSVTVEEPAESAINA